MKFAKDGVLMDRGVYKGTNKKQDGRPSWKLGETSKKIKEGDKKPITGPKEDCDEDDVPDGSGTFSKAVL